ncbi:MAG: DUF167 domain-containing protein [Deltaproteobacteria bacterium]|nr:DUF167 domain-containing protein [Deltaproteobacteria bacterium]
MADGGGVRFGVRAQPRASRERVEGVVVIDGEAVLKVALTAPPVEGEANRALVDLLAGVLGVPRRCVTLVQGARGRNKTVEVQGLSPEEVLAKLG